MKIAILFDAKSEWGGSYQMSINNLIAIKNSLEEKNLELVILSHKDSPLLNKLGINYEIVKLSLLDYLFLIFQNIFLFKLIINRFEICSFFEKKIINKKINLIIFLFTSYKALLLQKINFVLTVFDTCHRDFPEFEEIKKHQTFYLREYLNKNLLSHSSLIVTESQELKKKIINFYQLNHERIIVLPNLASRLLIESVNNVDNPNIALLTKKIKEKHNIQEEFFFYPAQFWNHKNHIVILKAVKKLKNEGINVNFVFCGRDMGNKNFIEKKINQLELNDNIKLLDYLDDYEILILYKACKALVMPTYFGPTNIPPIEAWTLNVPVLYSSFLREHGQDAAIYFHPRSEHDLIFALNKLKNKTVREELIFNGQKRVEQLTLERSRGLNLLSDKLVELSKII
jgi:glycosyltransferase involved in cell wall biosynthesis